MAAGSDVKIYANNPLRNAINNENFDMVQNLIKNGADIHMNHDFPLRESAFKDNHKLVKFLIKNGAKISEIRRWNSLSPSMTKLLAKLKN